MIFSSQNSSKETPIIIPDMVSENQWLFPNILPKDTIGGTENNMIEHNLFSQRCLPRVKYTAELAWACPDGKDLNLLFMPGKLKSY